MGQVGHLSPISGLEVDWNAPLQGSQNRTQKIPQTHCSWLSKAKPYSSCRDVSWQPLRLWDSQFYLSPPVYSEKICRSPYGVFREMPGKAAVGRLLTELKTQLLYTLYYTFTWQESENGHRKGVSYLNELILMFILYFLFLMCRDLWVFWPSR